MKKDEKLVLTKERLAENPAVDPKIVSDALKMRQQLERLGVWEHRGRMVKSPAEIRPALDPTGNGIRKLTIQFY